MMIVDAHLDLSYNVTWERDVTKPASQQPAVRGGEIATVGLPDLRAGGVGLVCATIFCQPVTEHCRGYTTSDEAREQALAQYVIYQDWIQRGEIRFLSRRADFSRHDDTTLKAILLLEGADAFCSPSDVDEWFAKGLRIVGLAWHRTRYAGGTGEPGPLTKDGIALVKELDRVSIIHDASHLAEESFWNLLDLSAGPIIASHSNCRAIVPGDRHLSDDMIRAISKRGGVIGINFFDKFLIPPDEYGKRRATLDDIVRHVDHMCQLIGDAKHVGLGTDMDGGLGRNEIPAEIQTSADLPKVVEALSTKYCDADVQAIMGGNWFDYFTRSLPK